MSIASEPQANQVGVAESATEVVLGPGAPRYRYGAKFEPPAGRIIHGMGQWKLGNIEYVRMLGSRSIAPASTLFFLAVGDWPRPWDGRIEQFDLQLREERAHGRIPHVGISLRGIPHGEQNQSHDQQPGHRDHEKLEPGTGLGPVCPHGTVARWITSSGNRR